MSGLILKNNSLSNTGEYLPSVYIDKIYLKDNGILVDTSVFVPHNDTKLEDDSLAVEDKEVYRKNLNERIHHYVVVIIGLTSDDYQSLHSGQNLYELITKGSVNVWDLSAYYSELSELMVKPSSTDRSTTPTKVVMFEIDPYSTDPLIIFDNNGQEYLKYMDNTTVDIDLTPGEWDWNEIVSLQVVAFSSTIKNNLSSEDVIAEMSDPILLQKKIGDISYETVWENNTLAGRLQVEYVDVEDAIYDQIPLQSLDALFYKIDGITNLEVVANIESLIEEFTEAYKLNEIEDNKHTALRNAINSISVVLQVRGDKADIVPQLNAVRSLFVEKSLAKPVGKFYKQLRKRLFSIDKLIRLAEKVRKKVMYNGKLVDERTVEILSDLDGSYIDREDCDFLYADWITTTSYLYDWTGEDLEWNRAVTNGYYFFDYEKSLRSNSILSRYVNINRLEAAGIHVPYSHYRVENSTARRVDYVSEGWTVTNVEDVTLKAIMDSTVSYPVTEKMLVTDEGSENANTVNPNNRGTPYVEALSCTLLNGTWSHLMNRRFVDVSVDSIDKQSGIENYRLMCFELMDFMDPVTPGESLDENYISTVELQDSTAQFFGEIELAIEEVENEYDEYLTRCQSLCSTRKTTNLFNAFFTESIMEEYKDNMSNAPWIRCPLFLLSFQNFVTGQWVDKEGILERAAIIVSQINPVNGNLISVESFSNDLQTARTLMDNIKTQATTDGYANSLSAYDQLNVAWYVDTEETKTYTCDDLSIKDNSSYNDGNGVYPIETSDCGDLLIEEEVDWTQMSCLGLATQVAILTGRCTSDDPASQDCIDLANARYEIETRCTSTEEVEEMETANPTRDIHPADTNGNGVVTILEFERWWYETFGEYPEYGVDWEHFDSTYNL